VKVVGELQRKRTLAASRGFLAAARLSCISLYLHGRCIITARQHYAERAICHRPDAHPSVRPSVTRLNQSKTVEVRIVQISSYSSLVPQFLAGYVAPERGVKQG